MFKTENTADELFESPHELSADEAQNVIKQTLTALGGTGRVPKNFILSLPDKVQHALADLTRMFGFGSIRDFLEMKPSEIEQIMQRLHVVKQIDLARVIQLYKRSEESNAN